MKAMGNWFRGLARWPTFEPCKFANQLEDASQDDAALAGEVAWAPAYSAGYALLSGAEHDASKRLKKSHNCR